MADPRPVLRIALKEIFKDHRTIRAFEKLFDLIPDDLITLTEDIQEIGIDAGSAKAKAQQALDILVIPKNFGAFFDTTDQVASITDTPTAVTFNNTKVANEIAIDGGTPSRIVVNKPGLYKVEYRVQL